MIHALNSWERRITCVSHPHASGVIESPRFGGIRTEVGPAGYVLQSGERIAL
jgi:Ni,Fe-hydrogenase I large subunit